MPCTNCPCFPVLLLLPSPFLHALCSSYLMSKWEEDKMLCPFTLLYYQIIFFLPLQRLLYPHFAYLVFRLLRGGGSGGAVKKICTSL